MAFFCAGAIQTYVTTLSHNEKVRSKKPWARKSIPERVYDNNAGFH
jgi:hypothetical protein